MARDPFAIPTDLHTYPADFQVRPLDFDLGTFWPHPIDRGAGLASVDETPFTIAGLPGFGPLWLDWLGGQRDAPRLLRRAFEGEQGTETLYAIDLRRHRRPILQFDQQAGRVAKAEGLVQTSVLTPTGPVGDDIWASRTIRSVTREEMVERRFGIVALLLLTGTKRHSDKGIAIRLALDVADLVKRRNEGMWHGMFLGILQIRGIAGERALKVATRLTRSGKNTVRANRGRPLVNAVMAMFASAGTVRANRVPHLADAWFAAGQEREVAIGIAHRALEFVKRGERPAEALRWALLVLCEGYWRRDRALPDEVIYGLAACLELLDREGRPRRDLSLAGVKLRRGFMMFAASCAWDDFDDYYWPERPSDSDTEEAWLSHPLHIIAKQAISRAGWIDSKIEDDHSEEDSPSLI